MNRVKYLKNWFLILLGISILTLPIIAYMIEYEPQFWKVTSSLLNTLIGAIYAVTFGIFIYWRQQKDKYEALKSSLINYLEYLISELPEETYLEKQKSEDKTEIPINISSVNKSIVNKMIESGYFNNALDNLIKLQAGVEFYSFAIELYFTQDHNSKRDLISTLDMIQSTQGIIQDESQEVISIVKN